ncbi:hypothetical protein XENORESO_011828 [Xenotaenia resolanae]|uniref:Uncharacterized protein n=1 Tax=Xenotaenia resolanae TaxID=208358 RepID=A0ABV0WE74_9TELE
MNPPAQDLQSSHKASFKVKSIITCIHFHALKSCRRHKRKQVKHLQKKKKSEILQNAQFICVFVLFSMYFFSYALPHRTSCIVLPAPLQPVFKHETYLNNYASLSLTDVRGNIKENFNSIYS